VKLVTVIGTRPEIIKTFPLFHSLDKYFEHTVVHTGQHYDYNLDKVFFRELALNSKVVRLKSSPGNFGVQISELILNVFNSLRKIEPDFVLVQGDTNSALAGALAASRLGIKLIHIEAGCRSGNKKSPEEQNRTIIDSIADFKFCPDNVSFGNLKKSNLKKNTYISGSTVFDSLHKVKDKIKNNISIRGDFIIFTMHRFENVSDVENFKNKINFINKVADKIKIIFPIHPRTLKALRDNDLILNPSITVIPPLAYLEFLGYLKKCRFVITDSGGIQEESAYFNRPCIVLRNETEWTRLVKVGKVFLFPKLNDRLFKFVSDLIRDEGFYTKIKNARCKESKPGASKYIIRVIRTLSK